MLVLTNEMVERVLTMHDIVHALEDAFLDLESGMAAAALPGTACMP